MLMETLARWPDRTDEKLACLDWSDQFRDTLGYRAQSDEMGAIYPSFEALDDLYRFYWELLVWERKAGKNLLTFG
jgi:hypothetical protein